MTVATRMLVRVELAALLMMMVRGNPVSRGMGKLGAVRPQNQKGQAQHTSRECRETPHEFELSTSRTISLLLNRRLMTLRSIRPVR